MRNLTITLFLLSCSLSALLSQNKLIVLHPQEWWGWEMPGTIEEAVYVLKPQGLYMGLDMYFTFSYPDNPYGPGDSLEIVFDFNLPAETLITDSWLWVGEQPVQAEIWEIWTATQTYEEIVDRQQDPSLLYKKPEGGFQLRIFPLVGLESRKVKISCLLPAEWTEEKVAAKLPTEFLNLTYYETSNFRLLAYPDPAWQNYRVQELPGVPFTSISDPEFGDCLEILIPSQTNWNHPLHFETDAPLQPDGLFVGRHGDTYQLAFIPESTAGLEKTTRLMVVIAYHEYRSFISFQDALETVRHHLKARLDENDRFNLVIGMGTTAHLASNNWMVADDGTIDNFFDSFSISSFGTYLPLIDLLKKGGDFLLNSPSGGEMLLFANSQEYHYTTYANNALEEFALVYGNSFPVHVCDYQEYNFSIDWDWNGEQEFWGNQQFNINLASTTGGTLYDLVNNGSDLQTNLTTQLNQIDGVPISFDLYTDMDTGFCYQRYLIHHLGQSRIAKLPILQVGKFAGSFPMTVEFSALVNGQILQETLVVEESAVVELDTLAEESWVGNHIAALEAEAQNLSQIYDIIDWSIGYRVLSKYTAFIALDPALSIEPCFGCPFVNDEILIQTDEKPVKEPALKAFPNPFSDVLAIQAEGIDPAEIYIFDSAGRLVRTLAADGQLTWDGTNDQGIELPAGLYAIVVIDKERSVHQIKVSKY